MAYTTHRQFFEAEAEQTILRSPNCKAPSSEFSISTSMIHRKIGNIYRYLCFIRGVYLSTSSSALSLNDSNTEFQNLQACTRDDAFTHKLLEIVTLIPSMSDLEKDGIDRTIIAQLKQLMDQLSNDISRGRDNNSSLYEFRVNVTECLRRIVGEVALYHEEMMEARKLDILSSLTSMYF